MRSVVGVDGCKGGWVAVRHCEDGSLEVKVLSKITEVRPLPDVVCIDIPIGLPNAGSRKCDEMAREFIGQRSSSVFSAPLRSVLGINDYAAANAHSKETQGKGLSKQAFMLVPKIKEVDAALQVSEYFRDHVFEVHPEVSFAAWNEGELEHSKKSDEGKQVRKQLVASFFGKYAFTFAREFLPPSVLDDDILDAYAATWSAWRIAAGIAESLPRMPESDSTGLEMAIWY